MYKFLVFAFENEKIVVIVLVFQNKKLANENRLKCSNMRWLR